MAEKVEKGEKKEAVRPAPETPTYPRDELIRNAEAIFGVTPEIVAGALHGNKSQVLSLEEVRQAIKAFLGRRVK